MLKPRNHYVPIGAGEEAGMAAASVGVSPMMTAAMVASVISFMVAAGAYFIFIPVFAQLNNQGAVIRRDENATNLRLAQLEDLLNTTVGTVATLQGQLAAAEAELMVLDFAIQNIVTNEGGMMNTTYEVLDSGGHCEMDRSCDGMGGLISFLSPYTIYKATSGSVVSIVIEVGPFTTPAKKRSSGKGRRISVRDVKSKKNNHPRAPGELQRILCIANDPALDLKTFFPYDATGSPLPAIQFTRFFTQQQRDSMVITGDTAGSIILRHDLTFNADNYQMQLFADEAVISWNWYPDWDGCTLNSDFDFAGPTKFVATHVVPPGGDAKRR